MFSGNILLLIPYEPVCKIKKHINNIILYIIYYNIIVNCYYYCYNNNNIIQLQLCKSELQPGGKQHANLCWIVRLAKQAYKSASASYAALNQLLWDVSTVPYCHRTD